MGYLDFPRLRGQFLTYVARGDAKIPLPVLAKIARTCVRKGYVSGVEVSAILDDVRQVGVEDFQRWPDHAERGRRFRALAEAVSGIGNQEAH